MKFSDIITVSKTVKEGTKGWYTIEEVAKELGIPETAARKKLSALCQQGRVEQARMYGRNKSLFRIIK